MQVHAVDDPSIQIDEKDVAVGRQLSIACIACHGVGLKAAGAPAPDLRESQIALSQESLKEVLKGGALAERGMPQFDFTDGQIRQLHAYIRATAREALGTRKATDEAPLPSRF
jgi:quinohemoprotein ethanol dehydrogenase